MFEAQAIAIEIEKITPNRPMTHDLFKSFAGTFNFTIKEIIISDLKEGVFFAKIVCEDEVKSIEIDSRPSDAIAIGLRFNAPIYTYDNILAEAGIELTDEVEDEPETPKQEEKVPIKKEKTSSTPVGKIKDMPMDKLMEMLQKAIEKEDYERAAQIRDEINKRN